MNLDDQHLGLKHLIEAREGVPLEEMYSEAQLPLHVNNDLFVVPLQQTVDIQQAMIDHSTLVARSLPMALHPTWAEKLQHSTLPSPRLPRRSNFYQFPPFSSR